MKKIILLAIFIPSAIFAIAQKTITGTVLDENSSAPLQGATVMAKESKVTTQTDQNGLFSIKITATEKKLVISYTGFEPKEVPADAIKTITIRMEKSGFLNEVSVIGSRNLIRTKVETPAPIDIIPVNRIINQVGQIDINQLLTYVAPSFQSSRQTVSDGTDHVDPAQLRGLGSDQVKGAIKVHW